MVAAGTSSWACRAGRGWCRVAVALRNGRGAWPMLNQAWQLGASSWANAAGQMMCAGLCMQGTQRAKQAQAADIIRLACCALQMSTQSLAPRHNDTSVVGRAGSPQVHGAVHTLAWAVHSRHNSWDEATPPVITSLFHNPATACLPSRAPSHQKRRGTVHAEHGRMPGRHGRALHPSSGETGGADADGARAKESRAGGPQARLLLLQCSSNRACGDAVALALPHSLLKGHWRSSRPPCAAA